MPTQATPRRIFFVQATDATSYPPVMNAASVLHDAGHAVRLLSAPIASRPLGFPDGWSVRVDETRPRDSDIMGAMDYARYLVKAVWIAMTWRPQWIYASDPISCFPALVAAWVCGAQIIYHEHDSPDSEPALNRLFRWARRRVFGTARLVVFPSESRAKAVLAGSRVQPREWLTVWNVPRRSEIPPTREPPSAALRLYYHGSINPDRLPAAVVEALAAFEGRITLDIAGYETASGKGHVQSLQALAERLGIGGCVHYVGQVSGHDALLRAAARCDVGLALMPMQSDDVNMRHMAGASNKPFDYLAAGLDLVVSDLEEWRALFVEKGLAVAVDPSQSPSLVDAFGRLEARAGERAARAERARAMIRDGWHYEVLFAPVRRVIEAG